MLYSFRRLRSTAPKATGPSPFGPRTKAAGNEARPTSLCLYPPPLTAVDLPLRLKFPGLWDAFGALAIWDRLWTEEFRGWGQFEALVAGLLIERGMLAVRRCRGNPNRSASRNPGVAYRLPSWRRWGVFLGVLVERLACVFSLKGVKGRHKGRLDILPPIHLR